MHVKMAPEDMLRSLGSSSTSLVHPAQRCSCDSVVVLNLSEKTIRPMPVVAVL